MGLATMPAKRTKSKTPQAVVSAGRMLTGAVWAKFQASARLTKTRSVRCATMSARMTISASALIAIKNARVAGLITDCSVTTASLRISLDPSGKAANGKTGKMCAAAPVVGTSVVRCATLSASRGTAHLVLATISAK